MTQTATIVLFITLENDGLGTATKEVERPLTLSKDQTDRVLALVHELTRPPDDGADQALVAAPLPTDENGEALT